MDKCRDKIRSNGMAGLNGIKYILSTAENQIIKDEITNDPSEKGYIDITTGGRVKQLNLKLLVSNPVSQGQVNADSYTRREIINGGDLDAVTLKNIKSDPEGAIVYDFILNSTTIDLNNPADVKFLTILSDNTLINSAQKTALLSMKKVPDPNWKPQTLGKSRAEELLGDGIMIEGNDIIEALK